MKMLLMLLTCQSVFLLKTLLEKQLPFKSLVNVNTAKTVVKSTCPIGGAV